MNGLQAGNQEPFLWNGVVLYFYRISELGYRQQMNYICRELPAAESVVSSVICSLKLGTKLVSTGSEEGWNGMPGFLITP